MRHNRWYVVIALVAALAWAGCGKDEDGTGGAGEGALRSAAVPEAAPVVDDLASLVPADAAALVYMPNPRTFEQKLRSLVRTIDADAAKDIVISAMGAQMMPGAGDYWDMDKPCAIAVSLPPAGVDPGQALNRGQGITMIFPMTDVAAAQAELEKQLEGAPPEQRPGMKVRGDYMAFSTSPGTKWSDGVPAIARTAPVGDVALRIDLDAVVKRFRSDIDEGLGEMEREMSRGAGRGAPEAQAAQLEKVFGSVMGWMRDFVNSAETLEIAASMDGATVDLRMGFRAKAGSKLDVASSAGADLMALAAHLPEGFPLHLLMHMEWDQMMEWLGPLMETATESMPEEMRGKFKEYIAESMDMTRLLGPNFAMAMAITEGGLQGAGAADAKDAAAYMARYEKLLTSDAMAGIPGVSITMGEGTKVAGVDVKSVKMTFDWAKMMDAQGAGDLPPEMQGTMDAAMQRIFGGPGMTMHMANVENKILFSMGDPKNLEAVIGSISEGKTALPPALAAAIEKVGGQPTFLLHADARALVKQIMAVARDIADEPMPAVPEGGAIPVLVWGKHDGRHYGGGLSVDVGGIVEMVKAMDR